MSGKADIWEKKKYRIDLLGGREKRVPIHDAIRMKANTSKEAMLKENEHSKLFDSVSYGTPPENPMSFDELVDELLLEENCDDIIHHIKTADLKFLDDEFIGNDAEKSDILRRWLKIRRETSDFMSYSSIPEAERTTWSAWYLRHIRGQPPE
ncbi:hypothetical protein AGDE_09506 [Angomonas deanei]|nr:hypothetical protein AGDE_09506 [Angomonas deanei]|eukprot:EPY30314.1 hypothetical protein AGDE_09506 [Angomonas deanei]